MNISLLNEMIETGYILVKKHPEFDLYIYNYAPKVQYDKVWNDATMVCRGLILDGEGNVIARPFKKFFNLGEFDGQHIPSSSFEVYDKMDGSLGITYCANGKWHIATRGSFTSDQAIKATELLHEKYCHALPKMNTNKTYLFEIIYPENRIVLDYGSEEALYMLAIVDRYTGTEHPLEDIGFPIVQKFDGLNDLDQIKKIQKDNKEGFVIKYEDGYRLKVKFEEYVRLHRILTMVSTLSIWEYLKTGQSLDDIILNVPDEFYHWVKEVKEDLESKYTDVEAKCNNDFMILDTRKDTALYFMTCKYPNVLFAMLDSKEYHSIIWKMLKPEHARPFLNEEQNII